MIKELDKLKSSHLDDETKSTSEEERAHICGEESAMIESIEGKEVFLGINLLCFKSRARKTYLNPN